MDQKRRLMLPHMLGHAFSSDIRASARCKQHVGGRDEERNSGRVACCSLRQFALREVEEDPARNQGEAAAVGEKKKEALAVVQANGHAQPAAVMVEAQHHLRAAAWVALWASHAQSSVRPLKCPAM